MADHDVEIHEFAETDIAVGLKGSDGTFVRDSFDAGAIENGKDVEEFGGEGEILLHEQSDILFEGRAPIGRNPGERDRLERAMEKRTDAVLGSAGEEGSPIGGLRDTARNFSQLRIAGAGRQQQKVLIRVEGS